MSNSIAPGSSADVNVKVTALTTNPNVPVTYKTIILKKNLVNGVNTLTQEMMSAQNTKYVVKYDYVLGEDITIPANCVLEFDGGSISASGSNDTITGTNTGIQAGLVKIFNTDVTLEGTWNVAEAYPEWFGAVGNGVTDDTSYIQKCINTFKSIVLSKDYNITSVNVGQNKVIKLTGHITSNENGLILDSYSTITGGGSITVASVDNAVGITVGNINNKNRRMTINDIRITGNKAYKTYGIKGIGSNDYNYNTYSFIKNVSIYYCYYGFYGDFRACDINCAIEQCIDNFDISGASLNNIVLTGQACPKADNYDYFIYIRGGVQNTVVADIYDVGNSNYQPYLIWFENANNRLISNAYSVNTNKIPSCAYNVLGFEHGMFIHNPKYSATIENGTFSGLTKNLFDVKEKTFYEVVPTDANPSENPAILTLDFGDTIGGFLEFGVLAFSNNYQANKVEVYKDNTLIASAYGKTSCLKVTNYSGSFNGQYSNYKIKIYCSSNARLERCYLCAVANTANNIVDSRPAGGKVRPGYCFIDKTLTPPRPIWFMGNRSVYPWDEYWIDATGAEV